MLKPHLDCLDPGWSLPGEGEAVAALISMHYQCATLLSQLRARIGWFSFSLVRGEKLFVAPTCCLSPDMSASPLNGCFRHSMTPSILTAWGCNAGIFLNTIYWNKNYLRWLWLNNLLSKGFLSPISRWRTLSSSSASARGNFTPASWWTTAASHLGNLVVY